MHNISGYSIYLGGQFSVKYSGYSEYSEISCTQDDHPVYSIYTAKLTTLLFNSAIVHQMGWISLEWLRTSMAWVNYAPIDQNNIGML